MSLGWDKTECLEELQIMPESKFGPQIAQSLTSHTPMRLLLMSVIREESMLCSDGTWWRSTMMK
jgi:hypothetical protein